MKILAIESSTKYLGIAIADGNSVLAEYKGTVALRHSQDLMPNIDILLKKINLGLNELDSFAISIGPGSFTGLRVGVSMLKGLNLATGIPIIAIPTFDAIAENAPRSKKDICVIMDARKNNLYASLYRTGDGGIIRVWDYLLISPDELLYRLKGSEEILFIGDGIGPYSDFIKKGFTSAEFADKERWFPAAGTVAMLAAEKLKKGEFQDPDTLVPMYMYSRECNVRGVNR